MHPILAQRRRLALYLLAWLPIEAMLAALLVFAGRLTWMEALVLSTPLVLIYAFLCLSAWYLCRIFPLQATSFAKLLATFTLAALLSGLLWIAIGKAWALALSGIGGFNQLDVKYANLIPTLLGAGILLFFLAVLAHYLMTTFEAAREAEKNSLQLTVLAKEAELRALKAQIDPHFLFNSLNSISALTTANPAGARKMCQLLADFFRKSLALGHNALVPLGEEISLVSSFLAIEQIRLGPRLNVEIDVEEVSKKAMVPALMLQPLVENAVRHGIHQLLEGGTIRIKSRIAAGYLIIVVENPVDTDRKPSRGKGIGMQNVRNRLSSHFGPDARLEVESCESFFRVRAVMPVRSPDHASRRLNDA